MSVRSETWKKSDPKTGEVRHLKAYRVDFTIELPDGRVERVRKASDQWTRREAEAWERQKRNEMLNPKPVAKADAPTVETFFDEWITTDCVARNNRKSTIKEKEGDGARYIKPILGHLRLDAVNFRELTLFASKLSKADLSPKSCRNVCATLRRMLVYAAKLGFISAVPEFPDIKVPKSTKFDWFNREEIVTLLAPVKDPRERAELLVGFDCGLRAGEQIALVWGDVNFHASAAYPHGWISVSKASSRGVVYLTKSGEPRTVPLTSRCAVALKAIRQLRHLQADALIFPALDDATKPDEVRDPDRRLERACARAGLRRIRRHAARHSFASNMVSLGVPLLQVSKWLGHSEVTVTARVYAHLAPTDGARWLAAYEATPVKVSEPTASEKAN